MTIETHTITFEQLDGGSWRAVYEDFYTDAGYGETRYEALEHLVQQIEELLEDESEGEG